MSLYLCINWIINYVLQQFFPEHMVETKMSSKDDTNGLLTHSERYKNLLLQVMKWLHLEIHRSSWIRWAGKNELVFDSIVSLQNSAKNYQSWLTYITAIVSFFGQSWLCIWWIRFYIVIWEFAIFACCRICWLISVFLIYKATFTFGKASVRGKNTFVYSVDLASTAQQKAVKRYKCLWICIHTEGGSIAEWLACWTQAQKARVQIAVAMLLGNSLRQTVHTHCVSVHQAAKFVAALLRVARVTAGPAESNDSLPLGLWLTSPAGWLPRTGISSRTLSSAVEYGLPLPFFFTHVAQW